MSDSSPASDSLQMTEFSQPQISPLRKVFASLRWLAALFVLALLIHFIPVAPLRNALSRVPLSRFFLVLFLYLVVLLVAIAKWHLVVNTAGAKLNFSASVQCFGSGLFGDLFLPSVIGGDIARLAVGISKSPRPAALITGNIADRLLDAFSQVSLVALGIFLLPEALPVTLQLPAKRAVVSAAVAGIFIFAILIFFWRSIFAGRSWRFRRRLAQLRHSLRSLRRRPHILFLGWLLGLAIQGSYILLTALLAVSCGLTVPLHVWLFAWPLAKIAAVLPITQGGIGVREAALVALLVPFGVPAALVLATGIVWEGVIISGGLCAGAVAFLLRYQRSNGTTS
jgi:glycosyltransferase 2 family protein